VGPRKGGAHVLRAGVHARTAAAEPAVEGRLARFLPYHLLALLGCVESRFNCFSNMLLRHLPLRKRMKHRDKEPLLLVI
jgi:hypothetical protein